MGNLYAIACHRLRFTVELKGIFQPKRLCDKRISSSSTDSICPAQGTDTVKEYSGAAQINEKQKQWVCQTGGVCD